MDVGKGLRSWVWEMSPVDPSLSQGDDKARWPGTVWEKRIKYQRLVELWGAAEFTGKLKVDGPAMGDQRHERKKGCQAREAAGRWPGGG